MGQLIGTIYGRGPCTRVVHRGQLSSEVPPSEGIKQPDTLSPKVEGTKAPKTLRPKVESIELGNTLVHHPHHISHHCKNRMQQTTATARPLFAGDTVLADIPEWAHRLDDTARTRMCVVLKDLGSQLRVALTSTLTIREGRPEAPLRPRIHGDGIGRGNSLKTLSEVVLEPDGVMTIDKLNVIPKQGQGLKRGELSTPELVLVLDRYLSR